MNLFRSTSRLAAVAALTVVLAPSPASASTKQPQCPDRSGRTIAVDAVVPGRTLRVYTTVVQAKNHHSSTLRVFSCRGTERKARLLLSRKNTSANSMSIERALAGGGNYILLSEISKAGSDSTRSLVEYEATFGKQIATLAAPLPGASYGKTTAFEDLQLNNGGAFAFHHRSVLFVVDLDGVQKIIPVGPSPPPLPNGILIPAAGQVALTGSRIYWIVTYSGIPDSRVVNGTPRGTLTLPA